MKIRNKILVYFSSTVIVLTAVSLLIVYWLFAEYREEEFQQRQNEKINFTIELVTEYKAMSENLANIIDKLTIHDFYDEKMLIFDEDKQLLFSSIDDLRISDVESILNLLSPDNNWHETKQGQYDIVGVYMEKGDEVYYAISKAYDAFGYSKIEYLRNVLLGIFIVIVLSVLIIAQYLSNKITRPITDLANQLSKFEINSKTSTPLVVQTSTYEFDYLANKFNELLSRTREAFSFQKHTVQHISHQLKTPITVLVSELEKIHRLEDIDEVKSTLDNQINKAKSLGSIINALLEISKLDAGQELRSENVRIDELLFDIISELNIAYPTGQFDIRFNPKSVNENALNIQGSLQLLKQLFVNLLSNAIVYSPDGVVLVVIDTHKEDRIVISVINKGTQLTEVEELFLFDQFFRGKNSQGKPGFGLGLVLARKIVEIHSGHIKYIRSQKELNKFTISLPY